MRYTTKPVKSDWEDGLIGSPLLLTHLTVTEPEPEFTGLYAPSGEGLFRLPNPIGFGRDEEW